MTDGTAGQDRFADDLVFGADPVLEPWNRAGVLSAADLHVEGGGQVTGPPAGQIVGGTDYR